jgi:putative ABC transport system permease protein
MADLRYGLRSLAKSRAFTAAAILTLALGIGASTAIYSVIQNVLMTPFPYKGADRLYSIGIHDDTQSQRGGRSMYQGPEVLEWGA